VISETKTCKWILLSLSSSLEQPLVPQGSFENLQILRGPQTNFSKKSLSFFFAEKVYFILSG
jgi:hypothetical protein